MSSLKKVLTCITIISIIFQYTTIGVNAQSKSDFELKRKFNEVKKNYKNKRASTTNLTKEDIKYLKKEGVDRDFFQFFETFSSIDYIQYFNNEIGSVVVNTELGIPILIQYSKDIITLSFEDIQYSISTEYDGYNSNIILYFENKQMYLYKETFIGFEESSTNSEIFRTSKASSYWLSEGPGIKSSTTAFVTVLATIITIGGYLAEIKFPLIGKVVAKVSFGLAVGSVFRKTYYTIKYQSKRSDCTTYIKQRTNYYEYSNYTTLKSTLYTTFHSVNPTYVGGRCALYN